MLKQVFIKLVDHAIQKVFNVGPYTIRRTIGQIHVEPTEATSYTAIIIDETIDGDVESAYPAATSVEYIIDEARVEDVENPYEPWWEEGLVDESPC